MPNPGSVDGFSHLLPDRLPNNVPYKHSDEGPNKIPNEHTHKVPNGRTVTGTNKGAHREPHVRWRLHGG